MKTRTRTHREYHRRHALRRSRAIANGTWNPWGDADAVRNHIADLVESGWSLRAISTAAGTYPDLVRRVHQGRQKNVSHYNADKILAVRPRARVGRVPADGSRRRLQALAVHGHSVRAIVRATGLEFTNLIMLRQGNRHYTQQRVARIIADAYPRLLAIDPSGFPDQVRQCARAHGWAPASAWTRYTIDDPGARPLDDTARWGSPRPRNDTAAASLSKKS